MSSAPILRIHNVTVYQRNGEYNSWGSSRYNKWKMQMSVVWHLPWVTWHNVYSPQRKLEQQILVMTLPASNLVNEWDFYGYMQKYGWRDNSKATTSPPLPWVPTQESPNPGSLCMMCRQLNRWGGLFSSLVYWFYYLEYRFYESCMFHFFRYMTFVYFLSVMTSPLPPKGYISV